MNSSLYQDLTTSRGLLALGMSLVMIGIIMRGFASSSRRSIALRQQHDLHHRKPGESERPVIERVTWFERNLGAIANSMLVIGLIFTAVSIFRK